MSKADSSDERESASPSWAVLSLQDGFTADAVYHDRFSLTRLNSTFPERCRDTLRRNGPSLSALLDVLHDARESLFVPFDADQIRRDRFLRALRVGLIDAIGYRLPREPMARPVLIPSHVWEHGQLDWHKAELSGAGFAFTHLRILIAARLYEDHGLLCPVAPLPELDCFGPSDEKRLQLGIPAQTIPEGALEPAQAGRPSHKDAILAAFDAIEKNPYWSNKEIAGEIRHRVKQELGINSDDGLGNDAILKRVRPLWQKFKKSARSD